MLDQNLFNNYHYDFQRHLVVTIIWLCLLMNYHVGVFFSFIIVLIFLAIFICFQVFNELFSITNLIALIIFIYDLIFHLVLFVFICCLNFLSFSVLDLKLNAQLYLPTTKVNFKYLNVYVNFILHVRQHFINLQTCLNSVNYAGFRFLKNRQALHFRYTIAQSIRLKNIEPLAHYLQAECHSLHFSSMHQDRLSPKLVI